MVPCASRCTGSVASRASRSLRSASRRSWRPLDALGMGLGRLRAGYGCGQAVAVIGDQAGERHTRAPIGGPGSDQRHPAAKRRVGRLEGHERVAAGPSRCLGSVVCLLNRLVLVGLSLCQCALQGSWLAGAPPRVRRGCRGTCEPARAKCSRCDVGRGSCRARREPQPVTGQLQRQRVPQTRMTPLQRPGGWPSRRSGQDRRWRRWFRGRWLWRPHLPRRAPFRLRATLPFFCSTAESCCSTEVTAARFNSSSMSEGAGLCTPWSTPRL